MAINEQIPLSAGPAGAAHVDTRAPLGVDYQIPMQVKPFAPIDVGAAQAKGAMEQDTIEQFQSNQQTRLEEQRVREEKVRDKAILDAHQQSGGDLYSSRGLEMASKSLAGKLSQDSYAGLTKRLDERRNSEVKFQSMLNGLDADKIALVHTQAETVSRGMSRALEARAAVLEETKDPAKADQAFEAAKQSIAESMAQELPQLAPKLSQYSKMTPDQMQVELKEATWHTNAIKAEQDRKLKEAQADYYEAGTGKREAETDAIPIKLKQAQDRHDAAMKKAAATGAFDPNDADAAARMIAENRLPPLSGFAMRTPYGQKVMSRVSELDPSYDATQYYTKAKAMKDFGTGKQSDTVKAFNVANTHLDLLDKLGDALDNGDVSAINKAGNFVAKELGMSTSPVTFDAMKQIVSAELVKAINGSGGGVTDRQEAESKINAATSPKILKEVISSYRDFMRGQLSGLRKQYESATGNKDFDKRILNPNLIEAAPSGSSSAEPRMHVSKADQSARDKDRRAALEGELDDVQARVADAKTPEDKHRAEQDLAALNRELDRVAASPKVKQTAPTTSNW